MWFRNVPPKGPTNGEFAVDKPAYTRTTSTPPDEVRALVQELRAKYGVAVVKLTNHGRAVNKTLHLDATGLYLTYSPTPKKVLDATIPVSMIMEFRCGCVTGGFYKLGLISAERVSHCFSLVLSNGKTWDLSFQRGSHPQWKNAFELLMRRARQIELDYPLRCTLNRLWLSCSVASSTASHNPATEEGTATGSGDGELAPRGGGEEGTATGVKNAPFGPFKSAEVTYDEMDIFLQKISAPSSCEGILVKTFAGELISKKMSRETEPVSSPASGPESPNAQSTYHSTDATNATLKSTAEVKAASSTNSICFTRFSECFLTGLITVEVLRNLFSEYATAAPSSPNGANEPTIRQYSFGGPMLQSNSSFVMPSGINQHDGTTPVIDVSGFMKFHLDFQHEKLKDREAVAMMRKYEVFRDHMPERNGSASSDVDASSPIASPRPHPSSPPVEENDPIITFQQFCCFLFDPLTNSWFKPLHTTVYQDMNQPICHYFISSSHNTYLTGDQLASESSVDMYRLCLLRGSRCVELDCWDGDDGFPVVYHGHTRTTKITFESAVRAIADTAFVTSPYPVILSLEVHTCADQQHIMAVMLMDILGSKLLLFDDETLHKVSLSSDGPTACSPEALKYKVLVKGKRVLSQVSSPTLRVVSTRPSDDGDGSDDDEGTDVDDSAEVGDRMESSVDGTAGRIESTSGRATAADDDASEEDDSDEEQDNLGEHRVTLADVVTVPAQRCSSLDATSKNAKPVDCTSFGEQRMARLIEKEKDAMLRFTQRMLARVYPKASRINSSNYHPQPSWTLGAQLVSLNFQTMDESLKYNEAKFEQNGKCGYILKPAFLRGVVEQRSPGRVRKNEPIAPPTVVSGYGRRYVLSIRVIAGRFLPKPGLNSVGDKLSPYVRLLLHGVPQDWSKEENRPTTTTEEPPLDDEGGGRVKSGKKKGTHKHNTIQQTNTVDQNGLNPVWLQSFHFSISCLELAMLSLHLCHKATSRADQHVAEATIPVTSLRLGYRAVPLRAVDDFSEIPGASLLCHFALYQVS